MRLIYFAAVLAHALSCAAPQPGARGEAKASLSDLKRLWLRYVAVELDKVPASDAVTVRRTAKGLSITSQQQGQASFVYTLGLNDAEEAGPIIEEAAGEYSRSFPGRCLAEMLSDTPYADTDPPAPCSLESGLGILRSLFIGDRNLHRYLVREQELSTGPQRRAIKALEGIVAQTTEAQQPTTQIVMPTGTGKTHILAEFLKSYCAPDSELRAEVRRKRAYADTPERCRILVLTLRPALLRQLQERIVNALLPEATAEDKATFVQTKTLLGTGSRRISMALLANYELVLLTAKKASSIMRSVPPFFDLIVTDESHRANTTEYHKSFGRFPHYAARIGLSAIPLGEQEGAIFRKVGYRLSYEQALDHGYITPIRLRAVKSELGIERPSEPDARAYGERLGTAASKLLETVTEPSHLAPPRGLAITSTRVAASACVTRFNSLKQAAMLPAVSVFGSTKRERQLAEQSLNSFRDNRLSLIVGGQRINEGIDLPSLNTLLLTKAVRNDQVNTDKEHRLFIQRLGHCQRISPGKRWCAAYSFVPVGDALAGAASVLRETYGLSEATTPSSVELLSGETGTPFGKLSASMQLDVQSDKPAI